MTKKPTTFALRGAVCFSTDSSHLTCLEDAYLVCQNGLTIGVYPQLPEQFHGIPCEDFNNCLIVPGMNDLHLHAPQYAFHGMYMDLELLDWLNTVTFPEEARYADLNYAEKAYSIFTDDIKHSATTRASIFGTLHVDATELLMDLMEKTGLKTFIGKVNMDRNSPDYLREPSAKDSEEATREWLKMVADKNYDHTRPILTPRFTPSCTDELMERLKGIQKDFDLPMQSHLSENPGEIAWVKELCPWSEFYGDAYDHFGLFGGECPTIMAHCVYSGEEEIARMKERGVFIAHCPDSNTNLSSGVAPVRRYLEEGMNIGLGSDVAGGTSENLFAAMAQSIQVSKLRWRLFDDSLKPLTIEEAFYMASKGGGAFFGKVGSFEPGYEFDAVVCDDSRLEHPQPLTVKQRLERIIYLGDEREVAGKYVEGRKLF